MKSPARCVVCDHGRRQQKGACPMCRGTGFYLVNEQEAKKRYIKDFYRGKVKADE